jgi:hypothetical protein
MADEEVKNPGERKQFGGKIISAIEFSSLARRGLYNSSLKLKSLLCPMYIFINQIAI